MKLLKILREVQNKTTQIKEYITSDMIYVRDYFTMSPEKKMEYLPEEYYYMFNDYISDTDTDFEYPKVYDEEDGEDYDRFEDSHSLIEWLKTNNRKVYDAFAKYLYDKIRYNEMSIPSQDYPAWTYFDDSVKLIKNQWLIHFTDDAEGIESSGFKYGVNDITKLGLTLHLGDFEKKYGGYNFAFTLNKFLKSQLKRSDEFKYGKEAVLFRASGIEAWHIGDEEYQVLFYGNTAKNIVAVTEGYEKRWGIRGKSGRILFEDDDLDVVVKWFVKNYNQYRKQFPNS
jgi:hypothetical protein